MNKNLVNIQKNVVKKICWVSFVVAAFFFIDCSSARGGRNTPNAEKAPPKYVYVGMLSFSGNVKDITKGGALVPLDTQKHVEDLNRLFRTNYFPAEDYGTALYYAVNKAIVNIHNGIQTKKIPGDLESVTIITITDGFDNSSANIAHNAEIKKFPAGLALDETERLNGGYSVFIKNIIDNKKFNDTPINAWALGFGEASEIELKQISTGNQVYKGDITVLIEKIDDVTRNLSKRNDKTNLNAIIGTYDNKTDLRIDFNGDCSITGRVIFENGKYFFNITTETPEGLIDRISFPDPNKVEGKPFNGNLLYSFNFPLNGLFNANSGVLYRMKNGSSLDREAIIRLEPLSVFYRKNAVVYFVLDCSRSMTNMETIRTEVQRMIDRLYKIN